MTGLKHKKASMCHLSFVMHNNELYVFVHLSLFSALDLIVYVSELHFYRNYCKWSGFQLFFNFYCLSFLYMSNFTCIVFAISTNLKKPVATHGKCTSISSTRVIFFSVNTEDDK